MRLDKFLKVSRIFKRRIVASEMCLKGRVLLNGKEAKPATKVSIGDIILVKYNQGDVKVKVKDIREHVKKDDVAELYELQTADSLNFEQVFLEETIDEIREESR